MSLKQPDQLYLPDIPFTSEINPLLDALGIHNISKEYWNSPIAEGAILIALGEPLIGCETGRIMENLMKRFLPYYYSNILNLETSEPFSNEEFLKARIRFLYEGDNPQDFEPFCQKEIRRFSRHPKLRHLSAINLHSTLRRTFTGLDLYALINQYWPDYDHSTLITPGHSPYIKDILLSEIKLILLGRIF